MLMVKADAYGFGLKEVAPECEDIVDAFGVVTVEEAMRLRECGISKDILICACARGELEIAYDLDLIIGVHDIGQVQRLCVLAKSGRINQQRARLHIKVDSGMHRLGFDVDGVKDAVRVLKNVGFNVEGVYSHLRDDTENQKPAFDKCVQAVKESYPDAVAHLASTHSLHKENLRYDMVRLGIGAYSGAMSVYSTVIESRFLKKGEVVSYGNYALPSDTNTAVVFGGYADGICREHPSDVYICGRACKVIGNVCMDTFVVDTGEYRAKIGDNVVIVDAHTIDKVAKQRNTIEYSVYTSFKGRVQRQYIHNGQKTSESYSKI